MCLGVHLQAFGTSSPRKRTPAIVLTHETSLYIRFSDPKARLDPLYAHHSQVSPTPPPS